MVTTYWFCSRSSKSIRRMVTCSPFSPKGIDRSPVSQAANSSLALTRPSLAHAHDDGAQPVEHVVRAVGLGGDLRVQPDQRLAQVILDQDLVRLAREVLRREVVPAEAGDLAVAPREARTDGGVVGDAAAEPVADEGFDGVGFVEGHRRRPPMQCDCSASTHLIELPCALASRSRAAADASSLSSLAR